MLHPDFDSRPAKNPFDRYPVVAYRVEQGDFSEERFFVLEFDLTQDHLGPMTPPPEVSEAAARARLATLGLSNEEIEARISWARAWMATRVLNPSGTPLTWLPPL